MLEVVPDSASHPSSFALGSVPIGGGGLFLIAGPCVLESETHARGLADAVQRIATDLGIPYIFKASYDKANRTSIHSFRGPGLVEGCRILRAIGEQNKLPVLTDVHSPDQCAQVSDALGPIDAMLQIPAFLCRQTDLLLAAAATGRVVNVKKGQFLSPQDMAHVTGKLRSGGAAEVWQTERGTTFGYQNLVVDMRSFAIMKQNGLPTIFDATHSVQLPGAAGGKSGGQREFVSPLSLAALAAGADGLFIETHPDPANAISDGPSMVPLKELPALIKRCLGVWKTVKDYAVS